ncbi:hypothetical protein C0995_000441 [Termitomyces sp. Mi166|nr:hypothetical protein C0995_000441 [Termitomyces sp. Mi166\
MPPIDGPGPIIGGTVCFVLCSRATYINRSQTARRFRLILTKMVFPTTMKELMVPTRMSMILRALRLTATQILNYVNSLV